MLTPWNGMDGAFQVHLCLYIQIWTQGRYTDTLAYSHLQYARTKTHSNTRMHIKHQKERGGEMGGGTLAAPTPIDSK